MTVYDCCMFLNENDLFEIRLNQHWDFVDKFIIVEAGETHTGLKKPLNFDHKRFEKYASKIIYVSFDSFDDEIAKYPHLIDHEALTTVGPAHDLKDWTRDHFQMNYFLKVLQDQNADDNDIVYYSCLDEIIKKSAFDTCIKMVNEKTLVRGFMPIIPFNLYLYAYKINLLHLHWTKHYAGILTQMGNFKKLLPAGIRKREFYTHNPIPNAGWHFTFLDGTDGEMVLEKQRSWAHSKDIYAGRKVKFNHTTKEEALERFFEDYQVQIVDVTPETHPEFITNNMEKFKNFMFVPK